MTFEVWTIFIAPGGYFLCTTNQSRSTFHSMWLKAFSREKKNSAWNQSKLFRRPVIDFDLPDCHLSNNRLVALFVQLPGFDLNSGDICRCNFLIAKLPRILGPISLGHYLLFCSRFFVFLFWVRSFWLWVWEIDENDLRKRVRGAVPVSFSQALALIGSSRSIRTYGKLGPDDWLGTTYDTLRNGQGR